MLMSDAEILRKVLDFPQACFADKARHGDFDVDDMAGAIAYVEEFLADNVLDAQPDAEDID